MVDVLHSVQENGDWNPTQPLTGWTGIDTPSALVHSSSALVLLDPGFDYWLTVGKFDFE